MALHGLFLGSNYADEACALPDCEIDLERWAERLEPYIATGKVLAGKTFTRRNATRAVEAIKAKRRANDAVIIFYSGHGTTDVVNGKPMTGIVFDDLAVEYEVELRALLADISPAILFADCCYAKALERGRRRGRSVSIDSCFTHEPRQFAKRPPAIHAVYYACDTDQTAASTGVGGAYSLAGQEVFDRQRDKITFAGLHKEICKLLPSKDYSQRPQFTCRNKAFARRTLRSFNRPPK